MPRRESKNVKIYVKISKSIDKGLTVVTIICIGIIAAEADAQNVYPGEKCCMKRMTWLGLSYQVPINPSKSRVYIWRKLKEYGACYLKQGIALLPKSQSNLTRFRSLSQKITDMGGEAVIIDVKFTEPADEKEMIHRFHYQAQIEYDALIAELRALKKEIAQNLGNEHNYDSARRMARRFGQARSRDYFQYRVEVARALDELIGDMAHAADDLGLFFSEILKDLE